MPSLEPYLPYLIALLAVSVIAPLFVMYVNDLQHYLKRSRPLYLDLTPHPKPNLRRTSALH